MDMETLKIGLYGLYNIFLYCYSFSLLVHVIYQKYIGRSWAKYIKK